jgi:hypothetical protein
MILAIGLAMALLLVSVAYVVAAWGSPEVDTLPYEFRKYLIQFFLIAALGAVVTALIDYFKRRAERREQERQYRTSTLTSLLERLDLIYQRVKQTRQRLGIRPGHRADNVDEMWGLRAEQQDLEQLAQDIDFHKTMMFPELNYVHELVKSMETYLGEIWREYRLQLRDAPVSEGSWREYRLQFQDAPVSEGSFGEQLRKFVESPKDDIESDFPEFSFYYHKAREVLLNLLVPTAAAHGDQQGRPSTPASKEGGASVARSAPEGSRRAP